MYAGKSQLMKYAARVSPRSVITSGKASSAAGLTAIAIKEDSHWALEAGLLPALIMSRNGHAEAVIRSMGNLLKRSSFDFMVSRCANIGKPEAK